MLRDIPDVEEKLKNVEKNMLENLHFALYGTYFKGKAVRRQILSFTGFSFPQNSPEYKKHSEMVSKSLSVLVLQQLCDIFGAEYSDDDNAELLTCHLLKAVRKCLSKQTNTNEVQQQPRNTRSSVVSARSSISVASKARTCDLKSTIIKIQNEVCLIEDDILQKQEEYVILSSELDEMKLENAPAQDISNKELKLKKSQQLLHIQETRLKNKEKNLSKYEELLQRENDEQVGVEEDLLSEDTEFGEKSKHSYTKRWAEDAGNIHFSEINHADSSNNNMEDLNKSINKMLARQTIGNQLMEFDGSSCLKWPIFYSQYKLSNDTCSFSPRENVLRLNKSLTGEARKTVEMLLIIAQKPDEILDILEKKYGRRELILDELLSQVCQLTPVESLDSFMDFSNTVRNISAVLEGNPNYLDARQILTNFVMKLPPHLLTQWGSYLIENKIKNQEESLKDFSKWIQEMSEVVSRITFTSKCKNTPSARCNNQTFKVTDECQSRQTIRPTKMCKICNHSEHSVEKCSQFQNADVRQRWKIVQKLNVCFCCLKFHHGKCKTRKVCGINNCTKFHNSLLHKNFEASSSTEVTTTTDDVNNDILLKVLPVKISGPNGIFNIVALLDEGSTATLLDSAKALEVGLTGPNTPLCCKWTGGIFRYDNQSQIVQANIAGKNSSKYHKLTNIRTVENLELPYQIYNFEKLSKKFPFVQQVASDLEIKEKPSLLIGQNNAHLIVSRQVIQPHPKTPILSKTNIGWTLHGPISGSQETMRCTESSFTCCQEADETLHSLVKSYMTLENFGVAVVEQDKQKSVGDERALSVAKESIKLKNGQYQIKLPWKIEVSDKLPESKKMAMQRLFCLENRLSKNNSFAQAYKIEIQKLLDKKYAIPVNPIQLETAERIWFLPHFPVQNPNKPGKVRIVFDAAAKSHGTSLNDFLLTGPDLLTSIFGILLKFRIHRFAFVGDIREMFNRVGIADEDTYAQCFLWRDMDKNIPPKVYRMVAMLFGITSSPFLAQFVKNYNADLYSELYPRTVKAIKDNHYVDDYLDGADSEEDAIKLVNEVIQIHERGGFEIRNFISNSQEILRGIPNHLLADHLNTEINMLTENDKILGMIWNSTKDCFHFKLKFHKVSKEIIEGSKIPTKRQVLKTAMSVYDPLGLLSPVSIKVRILLQNIWRAGIGWDDFITENMFRKWQLWLKELNEAMNIEIPRCYSSRCGNNSSTQIHVFSDASEDAYASAIFLRFEYETTVEVILVASKARVVPVKNSTIVKYLTIPKLELLAAVLGARLCAEVVKYLELKIELKYYWSDSRTVLSWLKSDKKLPTYMSTRVSEILELSSINQWKWVPTNQNVVDICTRDTARNITSFENSWFRGPSFLYEPESNWPKIPKEFDTTENLSGELVMIIESNSDIIPIKSHYSWLKLIRITARVKRFLLNIRSLEEHRQRAVFLTKDELDWSESYWWKMVQECCFATDKKNLENNTPNRNGRLHNLSIILDNDGILRISSRILKIENVSIIQKEPVILAGEHIYTQKMIMHWHVKNAHQGVETLVNELRRKFWIPRLRTTVKKVVKQCMYCRKRSAPQLQPKMGLLPQERLMMSQKPFSATGIDYFGPFQVKIGRRLEKRYGVLFTCLTMRAIHVEIAHSLEADACIMAIRRFLARRGAVKVFWSDNGTNFHGANRELLEALEDLEMHTVVDNMASRGIDWKFNPPSAPHMGGSWERLIGCFKRSLMAIMKERHPKEEVLQTLFAEVEYIVNSRPLTHVSEDPKDLVSISPNDILIGQSSIVMTPGVFTDRDLLLKKQWRVSQYLADIFWKRWLREYIPSLVNRSKWNKDELNLRIGELVVINDSNMPRGVWPMGIVEKVYEGTDGIVRVADIRTSNGTFKRPVRKLHRLKVCANKE